MKLMIGIPTGEFSRRADFYDYYNALEKPEGTLVMVPHGPSPAKNRNLIISKALENNCSHVFFLDDDMAFASDALTKLLIHSGKDVVTGLYLMRTYPHYPVLFDKAYEDGKCRFMLLKDKTGLIEIVNCGLGFCLIRTEVFKKLSAPWITLGEIEKDEWCDDVSFFNRVRNAGFKLYCDLDIQSGHMNSITIWPDKNGDKWNTLYKTHTGESFQFAQIEEYGTN